MPCACPCHHAAVRSTRRSRRRAPPPPPPPEEEEEEEGTLSGCTTSFLRQGIENLEACTGRQTGGQRGLIALPYTCLA